MPGGYTVNYVIINRNDEKPFHNSKPYLLNITGNKQSDSLVNINADWHVNE